MKGVHLSSINSEGPSTPGVLHRAVRCPQPSALLPPSRGESPRRPRPGHSIFQYFGKMNYGNIYFPQSQKTRKCYHELKLGYFNNFNSTNFFCFMFINSPLFIFRRTIEMNTFEKWIMGIYMYIYISFVSRYFDWSDRQLFFVDLVNSYGIRGVEKWTGGTYICDEAP